MYIIKPAIEGESVDKTKSINCLHIESISGDNSSGGMIVSHRIFINYYIEFMCPVSGNVFLRLDFTSCGWSARPEDAVKQAIEQMLSGNCGYTSRYYNVKSYCEVDRKTIHSIRYQHLGEPWAELFDSVFNPHLFKNKL